MLAVYSENHKKDNFCGQTAELLFVRLGGTYSYHLDLMLISCQFRWHTVTCGTKLDGNKAKDNTELP
jgi:hypothetical protein